MACADYLAWKVAPLTQEPLFSVVLPADNEEVRIVPTSSALQSMIRFALPLFLLLILLGWWGRRPVVDRTLLASFALLLGVLTTLFVNGSFVA